MLKKPKDDSKYKWTNHSVRKMVYYGLSADRIKRVIRNPKRSEKGIAPNTIAVMQAHGVVNNPPGKPSWKSEIWTMYQNRPKSDQKIVITAWRYPGMSPVREQVPIPADIVEELKSEGILG